MPIVEFVGASGVGKTTLLGELKDDLMSRGRVGQEWLYPADFAVFDPAWPDGSFPAPTGFFQELLQLKARNIDAHIADHDARNREISHSEKLLQQEQWLTLYAGDRNVIVDELTLQLFAWEFTEYAQSNWHRAVTLLQYRNAVLIFDDPMNIVNKYRKRLSSGVRRHTLDQLSDDELRTGCAQFHGVMKSLNDLVLKAGGKTCVVDLARDSFFAVRQISDFLVEVDQAERTGGQPF